MHQRNEGQLPRDKATLIVTLAAPSCRNPNFERNTCEENLERSLSSFHRPWRRDSSDPW
jgi:hypothetical protein